MGSVCEVIALSCPQPSTSVVVRAMLCEGGDCTSTNGAMMAEIDVLAADADGDCVDNEDDFTPEPCDEVLKGQLCRASLVHFYYGDGPITTLAQHVGTDLRHAMTGYDRVVLLIDPQQIGPFQLDPQALGLADVIMPPSEQAFFTSMQDLTARGCDMDIWIFSHGNPRWQLQDDDTFDVEGATIEAIEDDEHDDPAHADITTLELAEATDPANSGTPAVPIRMTYATACFYALWNEVWLQAGAVATAGAVDIDFFPTEYGPFATRWDAGDRYAVALANQLTPWARTVVFDYIQLQGTWFPWLCVTDTVAV